MAVRYSKSIKIGKYLRLNISKKGVSATLGKKGASINIGGKGTFLNISPALLGISGTGVSYRKKLLGGFSLLSAFGKKKDKENVDETVNETIGDISSLNEADTSIIDEYYQNEEAIINIHKYTDNVMSKEEFDEHIEALESDAGKEIYNLSKQGDEDVVENLISTFMNNLELAYDVRVNYELENNILYVDLDLPEIEDLNKEYPVVSKKEIVYKKKTNSVLKEEYARQVMSLGVFLTANFFNLSSYIDEIVLSAFTTVRDNNGDLSDQYLYSVKYTRDEFVNTDLSKLDDLYQFILRFENRINMSTTYNFKAIKPYEMESQIAVNSMIDDAVLGLKELGYKVTDINTILPELSKCEYESSGEYLKEGLRLLKDIKKG